MSSYEVDPRSYENNHYHQKIIIIHLNVSFITFKLDMDRTA